MSDRESKEIITPVDKKKIIIKTYLTGREYNEVEKIFLAKAKVEMGSQPTFDGAAVKEAEIKLIEQAVISIDNDDKDVANKILDLKQVDYAFVVKELNEMKYSQPEGKKKPQ